MRPRSLGTALALIVAGREAVAADPMAVFPVDGASVAERDGDVEPGALTEALEEKLGETAPFLVSDAEALASALTKRGFCASLACQVELAREVGATKLLLSRVVRFGDRCAFSSRVVDVASSRVERGATHIDGCAWPRLLESLDQVVGSLARQVRVASGLDAPPADGAPLDDENGGGEPSPP